MNVYYRGAKRESDLAQLRWPQQAVRSYNGAQLTVRPQLPPQQLTARPTIVLDAHAARAADGPRALSYQLLGGTGPLSSEVVFFADMLT